MTLNKYVLFLLFLASCATNEVQEISIIDPGNIIHKKISLSDITSRIQYISICNEITFGGINSIELSDSLVFITPTNEGLLAYDLNGKYKRRIGIRGRGPSEYRTATTFTLDNDNGFVYVLDRTNDRLLKYTFDGEFSRTIKLDSEIAGSFFTEVVYSNNKIYLFEGINQGYGKYNWVIIDTLGNVLSEKHNSIEAFSSIHYCSGNVQEAYNNTLYYWNQINDTIFKITDYQYEPAFLISQGEFRFPKNIVEGVYTEYFFPREVFFTKNYIFIAYILDFKNYTGIYSKSDNHFYNINVTEDWNYIKGPGIPNDFDSGLTLIPISYYCDNQGQEYIIGEINPFELKAHIASNDFKNSTPKFPEKKKELERLANSLDDNDNPVLMIVKLKD